jgi:hypothetical protein
VLVSCGFYLLILVVGYDRLRRAGARPAVEWRHGIPVLARQARGTERLPAGGRGEALGGGVGVQGAKTYILTLSLERE